MNTNNMPSVWDNGYNPQGALRREMDRIFDDLWEALPATRAWHHTQAVWSPACDVEEDQDQYLLTLDMPGIQKDQIRLELADNQLTISGERRQDQKKKSDGIWYSERRYGKFSRNFALPVGVDTDKIEAIYQDGTLRILVPKAASAKPRQIKITNESDTGFFGKLIGQSTTKEKAETRITGSNDDKAAS